MLAVVYHDIGLLRGRDEHARSSAELVRTAVQHVYVFSKFEVDILAAAIASHSSSGDIDTICESLSDVEYLADQSVRPRFVAALLRLSDELDEDYRRADARVADIIELPEESI